MSGLFKCPNCRMLSENPFCSDECADEYKNLLEGAEKVGTTVSTGGRYKVIETVDYNSSELEDFLNNLAKRRPGMEIVSTVGTRLILVDNSKESNQETESENLAKALGMIRKRNRISASVKSGI